MLRLLITPPGRSSGFPVPSKTKTSESADTGSRSSREASRCRRASANVEIVMTWPFAPVLCEPFRGLTAARSWMAFKGERGIAGDDLDLETDDGLALRGASGLDEDGGGNKVRDGDLVGREGVAPRGLAIWSSSCRNVSSRIGAARVTSNLPLL